MADRRMFHRQVVESDKFLDLPVGAQALYFHMGMQADDDGFVNGPKLIARQLRRPSKDLQALIDSGFLLDFDDVVVLSHWRLANRLRNDRTQLPKYPELARKLYIKDTGVYTKTRPRKGQNLLTIKKNLIQECGRQMSAQEKGREEKRKEMNLEEMKGNERRRTDAPPEEAAEEARAPFYDNGLNFLGGKLGKGVVMLTQEQMESLLEEMGLECFDYYTERLADYIIKNNVKIRNHYETIRKWWNEDRSV